MVITMVIAIGITTLAAYNAVNGASIRIICAGLGSKKQALPLKLLT